MKWITAILLALSLSLSALVLVSSHETSAHGYKRKMVEIIHPYTFEKGEADGREAAIGMAIRNSGRKVERLIGARSSIAEKVEIRGVATPDAKMKPRTGPHIAIDPGKEVDLRSSGMHVRLIGLKKALTAYDTLPVTLVFERAGAIDVDVIVEEVVELKQ